MGVARRIKEANPCKAFGTYLTCHLSPPVGPECHCLPSRSPTEYGAAGVGEGRVLSLTECHSDARSGTLEWAMEVGAECGSKGQKWEQTPLQ